MECKIKIIHEWISNLGKCWVKHWRVMIYVLVVTSWHVHNSRSSIWSRGLNVYRIQVFFNWYTAAGFQQTMRFKCSPFIKFQEQPEGDLFCNMSRLLPCSIKTLGSLKNTFPSSILFDKLSVLFTSDSNLDRKGFVGFMVIKALGL